MSKGQVKSEFPYLYSLVEGEQIDKDIDWAIELVNAGDNHEMLKEAIFERAFYLPDVIGCLMSGIWPWGSPEGHEIESHLKSLIDSGVSIETLKTAFRSKLLVGAKSEFEDTRYEIAAAARVVDLLDVGTLCFEADLPIKKPLRKREKPKNSDLLGLSKGQKVRFEVTTLHDDWFVTDPSLGEVVQSAGISSGFVVGLRSPLSTDGQAEQVKVIIEKLFAHHDSTPHQDTTFDGVQFQWRRGSYRTPSGQVRSIQFELPVEIRIIDNPVMSRSLTPRHMIEDHEQPKGAITLADVPSDRNTHKDNPMSTRIKQKLEEKLGQCEDGIANVVVLGQPLPMNDRDVGDAVFGAQIVAVEYKEDDSGLRHSKGMSLVSDASGPFVPEINSTDPTQFVDPFRPLSAVWLLRIGTQQRSAILKNPNASVPIPEDLLKELHDAPVKSTQFAASQNETRQKIELPEETPENRAQEFVEICNGKNNALSVLDQIAELGMSIEAMDQHLQEACNPEAKAGLESHLCLSNEQIGMELVLICHGASEARRLIDGLE
jgi:hypothetical protein